MIVSTTSDGTNYALRNKQSFSSAPHAVPVIVTDGHLSANPSSVLTWHLTRNGSNCTFYGCYHWCTDSVLLVGNQDTVLTKK